MTITTHDPRTERIVALRDTGKNLREIGDTIGLTPERVRQLLAEKGLKTLRTSDRVQAAIDAWLASGELRRPADVAEEYGLAAHNLPELRRACGHLALPETKGARSQWNADVIAGIIRRIADEQGLDLAHDWMRMADFDAWRHDGDPSIATIGANYLWSDLMKRAGFNPENAHKRGRRPGSSYQAITDEDLDKAVLAYLDSQPEKLSAHGMELWLMSHPEHPSMATVRNRFRKKGIPSISGIIRDVEERTAG